MRIRTAHVDEVGGTLADPVASATARWTVRRGLVLRLRDDEGFEGWGEASPLPGYSDDTAAQAGAGLRAVPWSEIRVDETDDLLSQVRRVLERLPPHVPSVRFAVETALLDLAGQRRREPLHRLLAPHGTPGPIPLCALVHGPDDAQEAVRSGYRALKMKIGVPLATEAPRVDAVRRAIGPGVSLRIDGNRTWPREAWLDAVARLSQAAPEWIEEPVSSAEVEAALREGARPAAALAADESMRAPEDLARVRLGTDAGVYRAWVLKPMVLGGSLACLDLAEEARARNAAPIVSHLFDGPVAWAAACALALALGGDHAAGLAPHGALAAWPGSPMHHVPEARLVPSDHPGLGVRPDWGSNPP